MNPPKCDHLDYINYLIASHKVFSNVEAAILIRRKTTSQRTMPTLVCCNAYHPASNSCGRGLRRWSISSKGVLVNYDTTLDKPYAAQMALATRHWSGKHRRVVQGINLVSLVWN